MSEQDNNPSQQQNTDIINRLAFAALNEQRRTRRWSIFFKGLMFAYLFLIMLMLYFPTDKGSKLTVGKHTALVEVNGVISGNTEANADTIISGLRNIM